MKITDYHLTPPGTPLDGKWVVNEEPMKITEQTLRELLVVPHTIAELVADEPPHMAGYGTHLAFNAHVEQCPACSNHIKAMCNEGRQLLNEWACSYQDSRVN